MKTNNVDFGKSFKFKHINSSEGSDVIYTYNKPEVKGFAAKVTWNKNSRYEAGYCMYSVEEARRLVENGIWIVNPGDMVDVIGSNTPVEITEESLLEQIKAFTATSNHSVFIHDGYFEVYQAGMTEFPYKCKDDETLRSVMQALIVLDRVSVDGVDDE